MSDFVGDAVSERITGGRPARVRAIIAAIVIGFGAMVVAYRLLRSGSDNDREDADDDASDGR